MSKAIESKEFDRGYNLGKEVGKEAYYGRCIKRINEATAVIKKRIDNPNYFEVKTNDQLDVLRGRLIQIRENLEILKEELICG